MNWGTLLIGFALGVFIAGALAVFVILMIARHWAKMASTDAEFRRTFVRTMFAEVQHHPLRLEFERGDVRHVPIGELVDAMVAEMEVMRHKKRGPGALDASDIGGSIQ